MANDVVPIGKYKGQPLERLMADQPYSEWLLAQAWFVERYADLARLLRMGRLDEPQDTPEHNALVARLIDQRDGMESLFAKLYPEWDRDGAEYLYRSGFHQELEPKGGDILIIFRWFSSWPLLIEAKPLVGDDYPSVIRQVKASGRRGVVIASRVEPTNLTLQQVRRQFELAGVGLVLESEFFEGGRTWAAERETWLPKTIGDLEAEAATLMVELSRLKAIPHTDQGWGGKTSPVSGEIRETTTRVAELNDRLTRLRGVP